jgi:photosystem II stability/assembly factor-like uncharacterized protein
MRRHAAGLGWVRIAVLASAVLGSNIAASARAEEAAWVAHGPFDTAQVYSLAFADGVAYGATSGGVQALDPATGKWLPPTLRTYWISGVFARPGSPVYAAGGDRLFVSRDGAAHWQEIALHAQWVYGVAIDPGAADVAYVLDNFRIWKTADAGLSWASLDFAGAFRLEVGSDGTVFAVTDGGISYSTDGGASFQSITTNRRGDIVVGRESGRLYSREPGASCSSTDKGTTWECGVPSHWIPSFVELPPGAAGGPITLVGANGGRKIFVSEDFGRTWREVADLGERETILTLGAADGAAYVGTERGVFRSLDRGVSWSPANVGLSGAAMASVAIDPADPSRLLASSYTTSGPNVLRSSDGGKTWLENESPAPNGLSRAIFDASRPGTIFGVTAYYSNNSRSVVSADDGASWSRLGFEALDFAASFGSGDVWAAGLDGVRKSTDGASWSAPQLGQAIYSLVFDGRDPSTLYAGTYEDLDYGYYPAGGSVFVSRDGGNSWTRRDQVGGLVQRMAADPTASGVVYAATSGAGVRRSDDYGEHWESSELVGELVYAGPIVADPIRPGVVYAAGRGRVFRSLDGARTWAPLGTELETTTITGLAVSPDGRTLHASSYGGGLLELDLGNPLTPSFPCVPDPTRLCLVGARYALTLSARRHGSTTWVPSPAHSLGDRTGYFAFPAFTGDANLPEVLVKMLGEGALGPGGASVFYSSLTSLRYVLTVVDTKTGLQRSYYSRTDAPFCGHADFPFPPATAGLSQRSGASAEAGDLSLLGGRFVATLSARHPRTGPATGQAVTLGNRSGYFSLPSVTGDSALPEVLVKMVDHRSVSGHFWFFYSGLTGLDYTLTLRDTETGAVRTYDSPGTFCGDADTSIPAE